MISGIYIHIPFCRSRCNYCHFTTLPYDGSLAAKYIAAVAEEISRYAQSLDGNMKVDSIYFGGGTPSLIPAEGIAEILNACRHSYSVSRDCEISLEANPETLLPGKALLYRQAGINRISVGAQSFQDGELRAIGRMHDSGAVREAVSLLRENGFDNINLDLLLGLPCQSSRDWMESIDRMTELNISHVSVYMLDLDEPCPLSESVAAGYVTVPEDDCIAERYLETIETLDSRGYPQYEISNFARKGYTCRHNLKYWLRTPVIGFGLASHSFDGDSRYANFGNMKEYFEALESGRLPVQWRKPVTSSQALEEIMFLGLRLNRGIHWDCMRNDYGRPQLEKYERILRSLAVEGFIEWRDSIVRLTPSGMLLSNEIFQMFL